MIYSEASYFEGYHFAHIAEWQDFQRLERIRAKCRAIHKRGCPC